MFVTEGLQDYLERLPTVKVPLEQLEEVCNPVLAGLLNESPLIREHALRLLSEKTGAGIIQLRAQLKWALGQASRQKEKAASPSEGHPWTDQGNAMRLLEYISPNGTPLVRYSEVDACFVAFTGKVWEYQATTSAVRRQAGEMVLGLYTEAVEAKDDAAAAYWSQCQSRRSLDNMVELLKDRAGISISRKERIFEQHPFVVNFLNGTLDLLTRELREHRPEDMLTQIIQYNYDPAATCPTWHRYLESSIPDAKIRDWLHHRDGSNLTGSARDQLFVVHHGPGGGGKGTRFNVYEKIARDYVRKLHRSVFERQRGAEPHPTNLMDAKDKRLVFGAEINPHLSVDQIKELTGEDTVKARHMRENFQDLEPIWNTEAMMNKAPIIKEDLDDGIWRRLRIVPWTQQFLGDAADKNLSKKLVAEAEGILAWMVQGAYLWLEHGLPKVDAIELATQQIQDDNDHVQQFLDEYYEVADETAVINASDIWQQRQEWNGSKNERRHETQTSFGCSLAKKGFKHGPLNDRRCATWIGLRRKLPPPPCVGEEITAEDLAQLLDEPAAAKPVQEPTVNPNDIRSDYHGPMIVLERIQMKVHTLDNGFRLMEVHHDSIHAGCQAVDEVPDGIYTASVDVAARPGANGLYVIHEYEIHREPGPEDDDGYTDPDDEDDDDDYYGPDPGGELDEPLQR